MNRRIDSPKILITAICLLLAACIISRAQMPPLAGDAGEATQIPPLWTAGGLSAGNDSAGQAARIATDASGNVTVVSGPGFYGKLVVTSYTSTGVLRWQRTITPTLGTFRWRLGGRCAKRRFHRDRAQPGLSRASDPKHDGPV